jgi:hypothetical protein
VPGILAGLQLALDRHGTRKFAELVAPAIAFARDGFPLPAAIANPMRNLQAHFATHPGGKKLFLKNGAPGRGKVSQAFTEGADWAVGMIATEHNDLLTRQITSFRRTTDGAWRRGFEKHRLRLWAASDVTSKLAAAGFNTALLDGYAGLQTPPSLQVYLAHKPSAAHGD